MGKIKTIEIYAKEVKSDRNIFYAYSTKIGDSYYKVKFTKSVANAPRERGIYKLTFDSSIASIESGKPYTTKDGYEAIGNPTIWVTSIINLEPLSNEEIAARNEAKFKAVFGDE